MQKDSRTGLPAKLQGNHGLKFEATLKDAEGDTIEQLEALGNLGSDEDFSGPAVDANPPQEDAQDSDG